MQGCHKVGRAISIPAVAVLAGLLMTVSFRMSHSTVEVEATDWVEPVLLWIGICMPTGSSKFALCKVDCVQSQKKLWVVGERYVVVP